MTDDWGIDSHTLAKCGCAGRSARRATSSRSCATTRRARRTSTAPACRRRSRCRSYASADFRLGDFDATTVGVKFGHGTASGNEWSIRAEYYQQNGTCRASRSSATRRNREQYPDLSAVIVQFGYRFRSVMRSLRAPRSTRDADHWVGRFVAMACPCEVLIEDAPAPLARQVARRRRGRGVAHRAQVQPLPHRQRRSPDQRERRQRDRGRRGDGEPARFRRDAHRAFPRARSTSPPACCARPGRSTAATACRRRRRSTRCSRSVGWHKVEWHRPMLQAAAGHADRFRRHRQGIRRRPAAAPRRCDRARTELPRQLRRRRRRAQRASRRQAVARRHRELRDRIGTAARVVHLSRGALATSGDSRRFVFRDGHRYSHILDARTGWPVRNAPHSITVAADTCTQAGTLTTLAMLQGDERRAHAAGERRAVLAAVAAKAIPEPVPARPRTKDNRAVVLGDP